MHHVQAKNGCDTGGSKGELLCIGDGVEPGTPDEVCRENVWRELFEKTGSGADFDGETVWFSKAEQACEKFIVIDAPQNGFLLPNAAVPAKLLLSLRIDGHSVFFDCTEFGVEAACKACGTVSTGN